ncbi:putative UDP-glucose [Monocercomonoides exilis]|uniref:putative UDP-glucose n=1 Tax=Monocercomonoides exilis TaxID=2049356 RepID=UPI00355A2523|nr:putative UDP-glucose [Monocercomonoides exilis]|eukprot:MONOS_253.1-p1 / transcript=MONOS_253.1 / gene=MONOS_253 / organism=Monocercomonoides_exilis_PA203 / gene_product=UDP-glucose / transcript_product=UDP-glucose / location=Mono_scaffold00004:135976-141796(-) / protein_length=1891 / sequence_SO=supercontig / SO=protein_coding / is_pseudo=false
MKGIPRFPLIMQSDHVIPEEYSINADSVPIIHLYCSLTDSASNTWIKKLKEWQTEFSNGTNYIPFLIVIRFNEAPKHSINGKCAPMETVGFGMELTPNLEKKAAEFSYTENFENGVMTDNGESTELIFPSFRTRTAPICGINVTKLAVLHPSLAQPKRDCKKFTRKQLLQFMENEEESEEDDEDEDKEDDIKEEIEEEDSTGKFVKATPPKKDIEEYQTSSIPSSTELQSMHIEIDPSSPLAQLEMALQFLALKKHIPISELKDIGEKTVKHVLSKRDSLDELATVQSIFPMLAPSLSHIELERSFSSHIARTRQSHPPQAPTLIINGRGVNMQSPSLHSVASVAQEELAHVNKLLDLGLSRKVAVEIAKASIFPVSDSVSTELRSTSHESFPLQTVRVAVHPPDEALFLNNIETDDQFKEWSTDTRNIVRYTEDGIVPIRRNIIEISAFIDLSRSEAQNVLWSMVSMIDDGYPLRCAIVPVIISSAHDTASGACLPLARWWIYHCLTYGAYDAAKFAISMLESGYSITMGFINKEFSSSAPPKPVKNRNGTFYTPHRLTMEEWHKVSEGGDARVEAILKATNSLLSKTLLPAPCILFNGIVCPSDELYLSVNRYLIPEIRLLRYLISSNRVPSSRSVDPRLPKNLRHSAVIDALWNATVSTKWLENARSMGVIAHAPMFGKKEREEERMKEEAGVYDHENAKEKNERERRTGRRVVRLKEGTSELEEQIEGAKGEMVYSFLTEPVYSPQPLLPHRPTVIGRSKYHHFAELPNDDGILTHFVDPRLLVEMMAQSAFAVAPSRYVVPSGVALSSTSSTIESRLLRTLSPLTHFVVIDPMNVNHLTAARAAVKGMSAGVSRVALLFSTDGNANSIKNKGDEESVRIPAESLPVLLLTTLKVIPQNLTQSFTLFALDYFHTHSPSYVKPKSDSPAAPSTDWAGMNLLEAVKDWVIEMADNYDTFDPKDKAQKQKKQKDGESTEMKKPDWAEDDSCDNPSKTGKKWVCYLMNAVKTLTKEDATINDDVKETLRLHNRWINLLDLKQPIQDINLNEGSKVSPFNSRVPPKEKANDTNATTSESNDTTHSEEHKVITPIIITNGLIRPFIATHTSSDLVCTEYSSDTMARISPHSSFFFTSTCAKPRRSDVVTDRVMKAIESWELIKRWTPLWISLRSIKSEVVSQRSLSLLQLLQEAESLSTNDKTAAERLHSFLENGIVDDGASLIAVLSLLQGMHTYQHPRVTPLETQLSERYSDPQSAVPIQAKLNSSIPFRFYPRLSVFGSLDPISPKQRCLPQIILSLRKMLGFDINGSLLLVPSPSTPRMPLPSLYSYATVERPLFDKDGKQVNGRKLVSPSIPPSIPFTLTLSAPSSWVVEEKQQSCDVNSIAFRPNAQSKSKLAKGNYAQAVYSIAGFAMEANLVDWWRHSVDTTPIHLRTLLATEATSSSQQNTSNNTIFKPSMAHQSTITETRTGLFSFVAGIGVHLLSLAPTLEGALYLGSAKGYITQAESPFGSTLYGDLSIAHDSVFLQERGMDAWVTVRNWVGCPVIAHTNVFYFRKNFAEIASEWEQDFIRAQRPKTFWDKVKNVIVGEKKPEHDIMAMTSDESKRRIKSEVEEKRPDVLNVFVALTGEGTDKLAVRMMKSVISSTSRHVVFWLERSILSQSLRDEVTHFVEINKNCEFQYVTAHWSSWDVVPEEKERKTKAEKLLFIDKMFPLSVESLVILHPSVVVNDDLSKLSLSIGPNHSIAAVPYCTDKSSTVKLRYWEKGTWKSDLQGKPYLFPHVIYVNMTQFRSQQFGDTIRKMYRSLIKDRNSLGNMDQDLLNAVQTINPVFALPQSWLWDKEWCSSTGKESAHITRDMTELDELEKQNRKSSEQKRQKKDDNEKRETQIDL